jgi:hypothetical protein
MIACLVTEVTFVVTIFNMYGYHDNMSSCHSNMCGYHDDMSGYQGDIYSYHSYVLATTEENWLSCFSIHSNSSCLPQRMG